MQDHPITSMSIYVQVCILLLLLLRKTPILPKKQTPLPVRLAPCACRFWTLLGLWANYVPDPLDPSSERPVNRVYRLWEAPPISISSLWVVVVFVVPNPEYSVECCVL